VKSYNIFAPVFDPDKPKDNTLSNPAVPPTDVLISADHE
jgi:hypothetical protein